jgi:hypothetical protein
MITRKSTLVHTTSTLRWTIELNDETKEVTLIECIPRPPKESWSGLGDVIASATSAVGIKPCGGCKQRQEALNKLVPFDTSQTKAD